MLDTWSAPNLWMRPYRHPRESGDPQACVVRSTLRTPYRHPRESGDPQGTRFPWDLDPRFRGDDGGRSVHKLGTEEILDTCYILGHITDKRPPKGVTAGSRGLKRAQRAIPPDRKPTYCTTPLGVAATVCMRLLRPLKGSVSGGVYFRGYRPRAQPPATGCHP